MSAMEVTNSKVIIGKLYGNDILVYPVKNSTNVTEYTASPLYDKSRLYKISSANGTQKLYTDKYGTLSSVAWNGYGVLGADTVGTGLEYSQLVIDKNEFIELPRTYTIEFLINISFDNDITYYPVFSLYGANDNDDITTMTLNHQSIKMSVISSYVDPFTQEKASSFTLKNNWAHIAITVNKSFFTVYINGKVHISFQSYRVDLTPVKLVFYLYGTPEKTSYITNIRIADYNRYIEPFANNVALTPFSITHNADVVLPKLDDPIAASSEELVTGVEPCPDPNPKAFCKYKDICNIHCGGLCTYNPDCNGPMTIPEYTPWPLDY